MHFNLHVVITQFSEMKKKLDPIIRNYLSKNGRAGGLAGKGSPARKASAKKANAARWKKHRENKECGLDV